MVNSGEEPESAQLLMLLAGLPAPSPSIVAAEEWTASAPAPASAATPAAPTTANGPAASEAPAWSPLLLSLLLLRIGAGNAEDGEDPEEKEEEC